jgi:preprotein translocase subunit YajC
VTRWFVRRLKARSVVETLIFLGLMAAFIWGFMILPQQRRVKRHNELVASIEVGDELLTTAGIYGTVTDLYDDDIFLEISPGVVIRIANGAVAMKIEFEDESDDEGDEDED